MTVLFTSLKTKKIINVDENIAKTRKKPVVPVSQILWKNVFSDGLFKNFI